jgi:Stress responsive A/B Barrel Domain
MAIRHLVFCKFRPEITASARDELVAQLQALARVEGIRFSNFEASENVSPENLAHGFELAFSMDFASAEDRDAYLVHPEHQKVGAAIVASVDGGTNGLCVFDMATGAYA